MTDAHLSHVEQRYRDLPPQAISPIVNLPVLVGSFRDYKYLSRFHYIAGPPATHVRVLCVRNPVDSLPIAVLVVSMPTLNGAWRELAWPGRYQTRDRAVGARRINNELRTISRVIVDPRYRSVGLARRLVESYLANPLTPATEAIAAMGKASPFFRSAGMQEYRVPIKPADVRLCDALHAMGLAPSALGTSACAQTLLYSPLLMKELRHWAKSRKDTRKQEDTEQLLPMAARAVLSEPRAYAHTHVPPRDK